MRKIRDSFFELFYNQNKRAKVIGCLLITAMIIFISIYALISREHSMPAVRYEEQGMVEVFYAWVSKEISTENREMVYQVIRKDNENYLYINSKEKGVCDYEGTRLAINFDLTPEKASNEALSTEDSNTGVGKNIYHLKKTQAEKYLKYLQLMRNYKLVSYFADSSVWDGYLIGDDGTMRLMYIYRTDSDGIMICSKVDDSVIIPADISEQEIAIKNQKGDQK